MEDMLVGVVVVLVVAHFWFKEARSQQLMLFGSQGGEESKSSTSMPRYVGFVPPPRANTTAIRYNLYKAIYMLCILATYLAVAFIPALQKIVVAAGEKFLEVGILTNAGLAVDSNAHLLAGNASFAVLAVVFVLLLRAPVVRRGEETLRYYFYEHAAIPAQQRLVQSRLRKSPFKVEPAVLKEVKRELKSDGFNLEDIHYDESSSAQSLWTKAAVLIEMVNRMRAEDCYKTAFATISEPSTGNCLVDDVEFRYQALKGDAKACLKELRERPGQETTNMREERFRDECHHLLESLYRLLSLVTLRSNFCECDVALCVRRLGFDVDFRVSPLPTLNDLFWLLFLLFVTVAIPLLQIANLAWYKALAIELAYFVSVVVPVIIAAEWPAIVRNAKYSMLNIVYPFMSGIVAALAGTVIAITRHTLEPSDHIFNIVEAVNVYILQSQPWAILHFVLAGTLAFLIQFGTYPDVVGLSRLKRYQLVGSLRDALILSVIVVATVTMYVYPELMSRIPERVERSIVMMHVLPTLVAFVVGFIVPTWYRSNANRLEMSWRKKSGKPPFQHGANPDAA